MFFSKRKLQKYIIDSYGSKPEVTYFAGDIDLIKNYYNYKKDSSEKFLIDDITWNDLNMDEIFKKINRGVSTAGEQYLYYQLRNCTSTQNEFEERSNLINYLNEDVKIRNDLQKHLANLGRCRFVNFGKLFIKKNESIADLTKYLFFLFLFILGLVLSFFNAKIFMLMFPILIFNTTYYFKLKKKIAAELFTVNYAVNTINCAKKIKNMNLEHIDKYLLSMYSSFNNVKSILKVKYLFNSDVDDIYQIICSFTFIDLIFYELIKNKIRKYNEDLVVIFEAIGKLNAAIDVASFRQYNEYCIPNVDFDINSEAKLCVKDIVHPLINNCVPNNLDTEKSILITGSNATGKSTFLKTIFINAILSQSICTCLGSEYKATSFKFYTSMALRDDLFEGDSYYIAEIKSLKRIINSAENGERIMCAVDEVLRGTNTVERIAASSEILNSLATKNLICLAATHDIELCHILKNKLISYHFTEYIENNEMKFDYKIKLGNAKTRNAIKLLEIMGYDKNTVDRADNLAKTYLAEGVWNEI